MTGNPLFARPLNESEQRGLAQLMNTMTGVAEMGTTLLRYGGHQFFDTGDDVRFIDLLRELRSMFQVAHNSWPASGEVRSLAIRFFSLVLSLAPALRAFGRLPLTADAAAKPVRVTAALHRALASAILASDYEYRVEGDMWTNSRKLYGFFWRYVSRRYTEGTWTPEERVDIERTLDYIMDIWDESREADPLPLDDDDTPMEEEDEDEGESEGDWRADAEAEYQAMVMEGLRG
jgi:hypothetical protein